MDRRNFLGCLGLGAAGSALHIGRDEAQPADKEPIVKDADDTLWLDATVCGEMFACMLMTRAADIEAATDGVLRIGCRGRHVMGSQAARSVDCKIGPARYYQNEALRAAKSRVAYSEAVGELFACETISFAIKDAITMAADAMQSMPTHLFDAKGNLAHPAHLHRMLNQMGDTRATIRTLLMRSDVFRELLGEAVGDYNDKSTNVLGMSIYKNITQFFGRDAIVIDSPALSVSRNRKPESLVFGLGDHAITVDVISNQPVTTEAVSREDDISFYLVERKITTETYLEGISWNRDTGAWEMAKSDHRDVPIVLGVFHQ